MFSFSITTSELFLLFLVFGLIFMVAGGLLRKYPPKNRNFLYGYRTSSSMKSQERWDFAQSYSAKAMIRLGIIHLLLALTTLFISVPENYAVMGGIILSLVLVLLMVLQIEKVIRKKFPRD